MGAMPLSQDPKFVPPGRFLIVVQGTVGALPLQISRNNCLVVFAYALILELKCVTGTFVATFA